MGNRLGKAEKLDSEDESGQAPKEDKYDTRKIYWDRDGNLRYGYSVRSRDEELIQVLAADRCVDDDPHKLWMIIPSRWIRKWIVFAHLKAGPEPGKINMSSLLVSSSDGSLRPNRSLKPPNWDENGEESPGHFRRVTLDTWLQLLELYGSDGPAIAVKGIPYNDISRWRLFKNPSEIDPSILPEPEIPDEEPVPEEKSKLSGLTSLFS
mmetsp:Transcript_2626/g.3943  ORF Transcript_2626/g.3943 Transcript_2626/m.3943 type:complete len:208 (-) Transcript_2626:186-809(-)|eukprot:CAMPEP_0185024400 /NCGR_PEP_ID=MMETSP1103-20130426/7452_1 /TAXON_ID=36769 /ORGANISM="Paraphysomonas bandaiensis, Strain Caron Lab Isolate" /LENGTH=207 /DNA_ID=CAMNT_0027557359 /DNA_START=123 /DNA_END=746 /DNA_ORIENTATION=+